MTDQTDTFDRPVARIEPWGTEDLPLLMKLNDRQMTEHVGGPETLEKVVERQSRYEEESRQCKIVVADGGEGIGWVAYWERTWHDQPVLEIGWAVLPSFQGRGIAGSATAQLLDKARQDQQLRFVHAFPKIDNRTVERDLPQARLHVGRGDRLPGPPGRLRAVQRMALRSLSSRNEHSARRAFCYRARMSRTLLEDAFEHHVWATLRLIDTCLTLSPSELERAVPGTYGTILDTQRHVVGSSQRSASRSRGSTPSSWPLCSNVPA